MPCKNSYIDQIIKQQKLHSTPGVGTYFQTKKKKKGEIWVNQESSKKPKSTSVRLNFLSNFEYLSDSLPGPGNYHPKKVKTKLFLNNTTPEKMIKFHKQKENMIKSIKTLSPQTYNPITPYYLFEKTLNNKQSEFSPSAKMKQKCFGTAERFIPEKKLKQISQNTSPGPAAHSLIAFWPGKPEAKQKKNRNSDSDKKIKNWNNSITRGINLSIYYQKD